jgi:hypothetical protein
MTAGARVSTDASQLQDYFDQVSIFFVGYKARMIHTGNPTLSTMIFDLGRMKYCFDQTHGFPTLLRSSEHLFDLFF